MISIGRMKTEEIPQVIEVIHSGSIANKQHYPDTFIDMLNEEVYTIDWLEKRKELQPYFVARQTSGSKSTVVGVASTNHNEITNVFVHINYQRQGIGRILMETVEQYLRDQNITSISLNCNHTSKLFYEDLGYQLVETKHESVQEYTITSFRMKKDL